MRDEIYYKSYERIMRTPLDQVGIYHLLKEETRPYKKSLLDFGCGMGYTADYLGAVGVDVNKNAIAEAKKHFNSKKFFVKTVSQLKNWRQFDAVICCNVLEHLTDEARLEFFKTLPSMLKPRGRVIVVYDDMYHPMQLLSGLRQPGKLLTDPTHIYCWPHGRFRKLLKENFVIEKDLGGNIQTATLPWGNRFATARLYVCRLKA